VAVSFMASSVVAEAYAREWIETDGEDSTG